jgi:membrane protein implicated in regulation of membrane protease activity
MLLFFSAILLYLKTYSSPSIIKKCCSFLVVAVLLFWSFEIQSFYVFIYAVLFALFVKDLTPNPSSTERGRIQTTAPRFVSSQIVNNDVSKDTNLGGIQQFIVHVFAFFKQHFFIILFPMFSFWLWNKLFPISGMAKIYGYNQISFSVGNMLYHFGFSCFKLFVMLPYLLAQLAIHNPITTAVSVLVSVIAAWYFFKDFNLKNMVSVSTNLGDLTPNPSPAERGRIQMKFWVIALISIVFFVAAFLPYNMVGKDYGALNRNCRNGLLAGFGIVIFIVLSIHHFIKKEKYQQWIFTALFVMFALGSNLSYMFWQNYFVRFQKTEQLFAEHLNKVKTDYLIVHEDCKNPMHQYFVYYEYNFMCKEACGTEKYLALDKHSGWDTKIDTFIRNTELYKPIFMFSKFNNKVDSVTQIHLVSPPNILFDAEKNVWHYWMNGCNANDYPMQFEIKN